MAPSKSKNPGLAVSALLLLVLLPLDLAAAPELGAARRAVRLQNFAQAAELYQAAADQGSDEALYQLANLYLQGRGVSRNKAHAIELLSQAASQGHPAAQFGLAMQLMDADPENAMTLVSQAASQGYAPANNYLQKRQAADTAETPPEDKRLERWLGYARNDDVSGMVQLYSVIDDIDMADGDGRTALHVATLFASEAVLDWLLAKGADPHTRDRFQVSPLAEAVKRGDQAALSRLLEAGFDTEQTLPNGDNLLHLAARQGHVEILQPLLAHGVAVDRLNNEGYTPLDIAADANNQDLISRLESRGAGHSKKWLDLNQRNRLARQAAQLEATLHEQRWDVARAAQLVVADNGELLASVLAAHPELLEDRLEDGSSLLSLAVKNRLANAVGVILGAGAEPDQPMYGDITPLHVAARAGDLHIMNMLLDSGANPLARDRDEWDSMDWALTEKRLAAATLLTSWLIEHSETFGAGIPYSRYVLKASQVDLTALVRVLLPYATGESFDAAGRSSAWFAARNGNKELLTLLVNAGVDANSPDNQGLTPFHIAVQSGCLDCARLLLDRAELNRQTSAGFTPLMIAVSGNWPSLVKWLLDNKADVEIRNGQGNTALILAVETDRIDLVRMLLDAEANVTRKNNLGTSALDIARTKNQSLYEELRKHTVLGLF